MLLLTSTSDLVQVITSGSAEIDVHASYADYNGSTVTPGRTNTAHIVSGTTTTIVGSPGSSVQRNVKFLSLHNSDASNSNTVTVQHTDGTNVETLVKYTLLAGETLYMGDDGRFVVLDASGGQKVTPATGLFLKRTIYTSGSNGFTPMAQTHTLMVYVQGGGGGGGASGTGNSGNNNAGGGGGSGAFTHKKYAVSATATYTAVVGGGGNGGVAPSNNGSTGTLSSFTDGSTQINGAGGLGGVFGPAIAAAPLIAAGGAGGAANANGDYNSAGAPGSPGMRLAATVSLTGSGGDSPQFGGGAVGVTNGAPGVGTAGSNYGGGGAGGTSNNASGAAGGGGSGGIIIVDEFS